MDALLSILVVDDEAAHVEAIRRSFRGDDAVVHVVGTLREYRQAVAARPPTVAILDLHLADGRAVEVLTAPPEDGPFPVVVMTSYGDEQIAVAAMKAGALDYIVKSPGAFADLPRTIAGALREWSLLRERKRAAEELRASEERFRSVFERSSEGKLLCAPDGRFLVVNAAFARLLGYAPEELVEKTFAEVTHPDDRPASVEGVERLLRGERDAFRMEKRYLRKDGSVVWADLTTTLLRDAAGRPVHFVTSIVDISERKRAEQERAALEQQLQQAMKMEAVGRLAGGVAHDFNNLLTTITCNVSLAELELAPDDPISESLADIREAAERAADLTRQLLAFSRKQLIEPRLVNLNELVAGLHRMLERLIGEDIELQIRPGKRLGAVKVDPGQFEQCLVNLAVNARDAMPGGGRLVVETSRVSLDEDDCRHRPGRPQPGAYVVLAVSDTGQGISDEVKQHLFEPFFTTKDKGRGTGLGLATIYGAVKQAGGFIEVCSELGHGTTFQIHLPLAAERAERLERAAPAPGMPGGDETILVVEDDAAVRKLATKILRRLGYGVLDAPNGAEACALVGRHQGQIDLLVTDVVMPGMNGRQLAQRLAELRPGLKVLYTSGYSEDVIAHHGVIDQGLEVLAKPYPPQALAQKIREVLDSAA